MPRHLVSLPLVLLLTSVVIFLLLYLTGIDPTLSIIRARIGECTIDPAAVAQLRVELGLDRNLVGQYILWISDVVQGNLDFPFVSRAPVGEILGCGLGVTSLLTVTTLMLALLLALPLGLLAAQRPDPGTSFLRFGHTLLTIAGLSYLGVGVQPPTPDWGAMLADAQPYMQRAPLLLFVPALAIFGTALSVTLIGQGLTQRFDPRQRRASA